MHLHMDAVVVGTIEWPDSSATYRFIGPANGEKGTFYFFTRKVENTSHFFGGE